MSIQEIARENKLNLIEISILVCLYNEHPNMVMVQDLIDDEQFFNVVINEFSALVKKGIVKIEVTGSGVVCRIV